MYKLKSLTQSVAAVSTTTIRLFEPRTLNDDYPDAVRAYLEAVDAWKGCDWDTFFGPLHLNLNRLTARQTRILADATSGEESNCWDEASHWLEGIERDAKAARNYASAATGLLTSNVTAALERIENAYRLESKYREPNVWKSLRDLIYSFAYPNVNQSGQ